MIFGLRKYRFLCQIYASNTEAPTEELYAGESGDIAYSGEISDEREKEERMIGLSYPRAAIRADSRILVNINQFLQATGSSESTATQRLWEISFKNMCLKI